MLVIVLQHEKCECKTDDKMDPDRVVDSFMF